MATKQVSFGYRDSSSENSSVSVYVSALPDLTGAGLPATTDAFLNDALGFLSEGDNTVITASSTRSQSVASIGTGNREDKYLVRLQDNVTGEIVTFTVPCRKSSLTKLAGTDILDSTQAGYAEFKTATESYVKSKAGNACTVVDVRIVGRNL